MKVACFAARRTDFVRNSSRMLLSFATLEKAPKATRKPVWVTDRLRVAVSLPSLQSTSTIRMGLYLFTVAYLAAMAMMKIAQAPVDAIVRT